MPQPRQLADWIRLDGVVGDLSGILPELEGWAGLARHWREIAVEIRKLQVEAPVDSPVRLALYLSAHAGDDAVKTIFETLGLGDLHATLVAQAARLADPTASWAKLLKPMADFSGADPDPAAPGFGFDAPGEDGEFSLSVPPLHGSAAATAGPASLSFDIGVQGELDCEAGAPWPFRSDNVPGGLLRIGAAGKVTTRAGLSLPFGQFGEGTAHAGAQGEAAIGFFFRPQDSATAFGEILVRSLGALPSPLDLGDLSHAMALSGLEGIALGCDGAIEAGLGILIGKDIDVPKFASGRIGLAADINFRRKARWILSLRRTADGMRFVLSRDDSRERNWSAGIDLSLDAAPLARRIEGLLLEAKDFAGPALGRIKPFLSPGTYIATQAEPLLRSTVQSIVGDPALRDALIKDLSLVTGSPTADTSALADLLASKIADFAAGATGGIFATAESWTAQLVGKLTRAVPAIAAPELESALKTRIEPLLQSVRDDFDSALSGLLSNQDLSKKLAKELAALGASVKEKERDADVLMAGVREAIAKVEKFADDLLAATRDAAKSKLQARFGWSGSDSSGQKYELIGTFGEANADTAELWRALVTGRLQPFQTILANPASAPPGLRLAPESSLSRFAARERGFAFELVLFGIDVSIASIVKGDATITTNVAGDIAVTAKGSALRQVEGFDEGRAATFLSSWDLLLLKADAEDAARRNLNVSVGFDHSDKNLKPSEVDAMLAGLGAQGLVTPTRVAAAQSIYQDWRIRAAPGGKVKGQISVRMQLPATAVNRMVAIGREINRGRNASLLALFRFAVAVQIAAGVTSQKQYERDIDTARDHFTISVKSDDPAVYLVALWNSKIRLLPSQGSGPRLSALAQLIPRAGALASLLGSMAEIYDAVPAAADGASPGWSARDYAAAEKRLVSASRSWLRLNQDFIFWFKAGLHPALLAFLRLLAAFNAPQGEATSPADGLMDTIDPAASDALLLITMTSGTDGKTLPV